MRPLLRGFCITSCLLACTPVLGGIAPERPWKQVHPYWQGAYVCSFRSPDLLTDDADEQWGRSDGRLTAGGILTDFPRWLRARLPDIAAARQDDRPILIALNVHSGWGTGLITYTRDLHRAQAANYPWLVRQLLDLGLGNDDVTVTVDTCNAQATAAHQLRPDLVPGGVSAWPPFAQWRRASAERRKLPLAGAYRIFTQDRIRMHLNGAARASRANVQAAELRPLTRAERDEFRAHLYGNRGVIVATPTFFNVLRLGPEPRSSETANLLRDRLVTVVWDGNLSRNRSEFLRFSEYDFLEAAGIVRDSAVATLKPAAAPKRSSADRSGAAGHATD